MADARVEFMATLLADGRVLVAGGFANGNGEDPRASAEIFDPSSGTWTTTGSMIEARAGAAATLLPNGKVLVAGGGISPAHVALASTELYDPSTGTWSASGRMSGPRAGGSATVLGNGQVLVAGGGNGIDDSGILASAELYDPGTGKWASTGSMLEARATSATVLLPNGKVLVAAGLGKTTGLASAELYDPRGGKWRATGSMHTVRVGHAATSLSDGKVLVAGGISSGFTGDLTPSDILASAEVYDVATGSWTATGDMATPRFNFAAVRLRDGRVLVEAGDTLGSGPLISTELYDLCVPRGPRRCLSSRAELRREPSCCPIARFSWSVVKVPAQPVLLQRRYFSRERALTRRPGRPRETAQRRVGQDPFAVDGPVERA
jgi:hypothetical protein